MPDDSGKAISARQDWRWYCSDWCSGTTYKHTSCQDWMPRGWSKIPSSAAKRALSIFEITVRILEEMVDVHVIEDSTRTECEDGFTKTQRKHLTSFAQVNKLFRAAATPLLFSKFVSIGDGTRTNLLYRSLQEHPSLGSYVKHLDLGCLDLTAHGEAKVLDLCPNLRALDSRDARSLEYCRTPLVGLDRLRLRPRVSYEGGHRPQIRITERLHKLMLGTRVVQMFEVDLVFDPDSAFKGYCYDICEDDPPRMDTLFLYEARVAAEVLDTVWPLWTRKVRNLHLRNDTVEEPVSQNAWQCVMTSLAGSVENLRVEEAYHGQIIGTSLSFFLRATSLSITTHDSNPFEDLIPWATRVGHFLELPLGLESLTMEFWIDVEAPGITTFLQRCLKPSFLRNLKGIPAIWRKGLAGEWDEEQWQEYSESVANAYESFASRGLLPILRIDGYGRIEDFEQQIWRNDC